MSKSIASTSVEATAAPATVSHRIRFFFVMSLVLFLPVAVGFGPTFFLRPWSGARDYLGASLPVHLIIHGCVLTAWCLLFIAQTTLVAAHRVDLHRRLGAFGVGLAVAVVLMSIITIVHSVPRASAAHFPTEAIVGVVVSDMAILVWFVSFVAGGIYLRKRAATHKRLMFLASSVIIGPAFTPNRVLGRTLSHLISGMPALPLLLFLAPILALVAYDVVTRKRVHAATLFGIAMVVAMGIAAIIVSSTGLGTRLVEWLR